MRDWTGNTNSAIKTIGAHNGIEEPREENDYYTTDPKAIDKLLTVEQPSYNIWECAAGGGHLAQRLKEQGYKVTTSDIIQRNYALDFTYDFLEISKCGLGTNEEYDILTNPPYKYAKEFVLKALDIVKEGRKVYMFLKLTFLEGKARFKDLFSKYPPKKIYIFSERISCAKNGQFGKFSQSAIAYAWYVWEKGWNGKTTIEWI